MLSQKFRKSEISWEIFGSKKIWQNPNGSIVMLDQLSFRFKKYLVILFFCHSLVFQAVDEQKHAKL